MKRFEYLLKKISESTFSDTPFRHIYIENFFNESDFKEIIECPEIATSQVTNDRDLFSELLSRGYKVISFPGCITDVDRYCEWHAQKKKNTSTNSSCAGFGVVLRLVESKSLILNSIKEFMLSSDFTNCITEKFGLPENSITIDNGIQKYLDGYEISPHPDIRRKAATFMVNINNTESSEIKDHHTHYLKFKEKYEYVETFWRGNPHVERCWVPWDWCSTSFQQSSNNSIVLFSPSDDTMHAVKASYDHLKGQRTQLYGNLWYEQQALQQIPWEHLDIFHNTAARPTQARQYSMSSQIKSWMPQSIKKFIKPIISPTQHTRDI